MAEGTRSTLHVRLDAGLRRQAESVLAQLGITPDEAVRMFYSQICLQRGLPFTPRLPAEPPQECGGGIEIRGGKTYVDGFEQMELNL